MHVHKWLCIPSNGAPSTLAHMNLGDCAGVCHACEPAAWLHRALGDPWFAVYAHSPSHSLAILLQPVGKYLLQTNRISAPILFSVDGLSIYPAQPCPAPVALTCPSSAIQGGGNIRAGSSVSAMCKMVVLADVHGVLIGLAVAWVVAHWLHANLFAVVDHDVAVLARGG